MANFVHVEVTALDIAAGQRENCERCPVALAVTRVIPRPWVLVNVVGMWISLYPLVGPGIRVFTPREVRFFVERFDRGEPVEPFAFELDLEARMHD